MARILEAAAEQPGFVGVFLSPFLEIELLRLTADMLFQQGISRRANEAQVGRELPVIVDGSGDGISLGRTYREAPDIDGWVLLARELPVGDMVQARIVEAREYDLVAEVLD